MGLLERARRELRVDGPPWARWLADSVSILTMLSVLSGVWFGPVAVALMALALLGVVVVRLVLLTGQVKALALVGILGAAWAALLDGYQRVPWLDIVAHALVTGLLAAVSLALLTDPRLRDARATTRLGDGPDVVLLSIALGALLALLWEVAEWVGHTYLEPKIYVSYDDTIGDLAAGLAGSAVAGLLLHRTMRTSELTR